MAAKKSTGAGRGRPRKNATNSDAAGGAPAPGTSDAALEATLLSAANSLRGRLEAGEYKHVVLGLVFLKYISDAFEARRATLAADPVADPEDPDEYRSEGVFWVPPEARWGSLRDAARLPEIGQKVDAALAAIEVENPSLKGVLRKDYGRANLDKIALGKLVDLFSSIPMAADAEGARDLLGRVYEYFLRSFALQEGRQSGEFYTPRSVVRLLVEMLEPFQGRVYDPCCGSGGMFVQSEKFVEEHGGRLGDLSIYGQEYIETTWRLSRMNLAIRGLDADIKLGDSFLNDQHPDLKADYILANPPFNVKDWNGELLSDDRRWQYGTPPAGNANYAWLQHIISKLAPRGVAGVVLANGSMSSNQSGEGEIRKALIEADLVDCMVALPGQLFFSTQIPACLWFLARDRKNDRFRDRRGQLLFIDARRMGAMVTRTQRELTSDDVAKIAATYHAWRGEEEAGTYADVDGFCKSASFAEIQQHGFVLTPGRYVGAAADEEDDEPFEDKMRRLVTALREQQAEAEGLDAKITANLKELGYGW
jgi:type I restriction enzyme M protein